VWNIILESILEGAPFFLSAAAGAIVFGLFLLPCRKPPKRAGRWSQFMQNLLFVFFACLLGLIVGVLAGYSREPAIGAVIPAVLTLIGALVGVAYSGSLSLNRENRLAIVVAAIALVMFLFWGTLAGARLRHPWNCYLGKVEAYKNTLEMQRLRYQADLEKQKLAYQAKIERETMQYKADLDIYKESRTNRKK
jgi:hypothetical protein